MWVWGLTCLTKDAIVLAVAMDANVWGVIGVDFNKDIIVWWYGKHGQFGMTTTRLEHNITKNNPPLQLQALLHGSGAEHICQKHHFW
jgi:hypothetical protein